MSTPLKFEELTDGLTTLVLAIRADSQLSRWFEALQKLPPPQRKIELSRMKRTLVTDESRHRHPAAECLSWLADERIFEAVLLAIKSQ